MKKPSTLPIVDRSPLNHDGESLIEDIGCRDAQKARNLSSKAPIMPDEATYSVEKSELLSHISETAMSCVAVLAPVPLESRVLIREKSNTWMAASSPVSNYDPASIVES